MSRLIVFEGPDASGKTTLIKKLTEKHENIELIYTDRILNVDGNNDKHIAFQLDIAYEVNSSPDKIFLLDRSWLSSIVYESLRNRQKNVNVFWRRHLALLNATDVFHIFLTRPVFDNYQDDLIQLNKMQDKYCIERYNSLHKALIALGYMSINLDVVYSSNAIFNQNLIEKYILAK